MDRIEQLRVIIDDLIMKNPDPEEIRAGFIHLYGVSETCAILALKRGLDIDLCMVAGMLHDIWNYKIGDDPYHGQLGAVEARKILEGSGNYTPREIELVCTAISRHSDKQSIGGEIDELLKDADVFQHYLYHPGAYQILASNHSTGKSGDTSARIQRLERVLDELGIKLKVQ